MSFEVYALLLTAGIAGGYLSGLIGIGGGIIYVFVIPYTLHFWNIPVEWQAQFTIANSLAAIFFSSLAANYAHYQKGYFFLKPVLIIGIGAIISSWVSLQFVVNTPLFSMKVFLICLILLMAYMLILTIKGAAVREDQSVENIPTWALLMIGVVSGFVASASGLGGGIVVIPFLNRFFKIDIRKAGAIAIGVIMLSSFVMTIINSTSTLPLKITGTCGLIIPVVCLVLSLSVIITSPIGVASAHKMNPRWISLFYAGFLLSIIMDKSIRLLFLLGYTS
ncbi:MAG TPA: sulfite exporter TauE/SafE family protein [Cytophagaceae bacterium]|nr:sulfite exporter TauE/SafE family protein [Cytophagaceae bacterium]